MREEQLNVKRISQAFRYMPGSIILAADDGTVQFPDDQGNFSLASYLSYKVQGDTLIEGPASSVVNSSSIASSKYYSTC